MIDRSINIHIAEIQIDIRRYTVDGTFGSILPHVIISIIRRNVRIFRQPCVIAGQFFHLHFTIEPVGGTVNAGCISRGRDCLQKCLMNPRPFLCFQLIGSPVSASALTVEEHRIVHIIPSDQINDHAGLFHCFHFIDRLCKKIYADRNIRCDRPAYVFFISRVDNQRTAQRTAVAASDNGKLHAILLNSFPINCFIPLGNVNSLFHILA